MDWTNNIPTRLTEMFQSDGTIEQIAVKSALLLSAALIFWLVSKTAISFIRKRTRHVEFVKNNLHVFDALKRGVMVLLIWILGFGFIQLFKLTMLEKFFNATCIILLSIPAADFLNILVRYGEKRIAKNTETQVDDVVFDLLNKFIKVIIYITAAILALDFLGVNVIPFIAGAGVAGIAIGFAAKDTLSNLIAGVLLIIDRPFEIGDRIEVWSSPKGSSTWGDVVDIGLRATKIRTTDNIVIIIPNNEIMMRDIINYTTNSNIIRVRVNIGVAYETDIDKAKKIIMKVAGELDVLHPDPPPKVVVRNFGESTVDLQLRVWINQARKRMDTISFITDRVKTEFDKAGIEVPYPKRQITITQTEKKAKGL